MKAMDIFCGAGGLSLGLGAAGFSVVGAVEREPAFCETFSRFHSATEVLQADVQSINFKKYAGLDLLAGGPPCQPFSSGGLRLSSEDARDMTGEFVRAVRDVRPTAFLMENVPGLAAASRAEYFSSLLRQLRAIGYTTVWKVVNAAEYGVPQTRRRLFVVGTRKSSKEFVFPAATHGPGTSRPFVPSGRYLKRGKTLGDANESIVVYAKRPDLRPNPYHGQLFNGGGRPVDLAAPCHTILASAGGNKTHFIDEEDEVPPYHEHLKRGGKPKHGVFSSGRRLTTAECALIQTFATNTKFAGSRSKQYTQIGNAVPPKLAEVLGRAIFEHIGKNRSAG